MNDDTIPEPVYDSAYFRAAFRLAAEPRGIPRDDPDLIAKCEAALASRILVARDRKSYRVLDADGNAFPGSPRYGLAKLTSEIVGELERERGLSDAEYLAARRRETDSLL